MEESRSKYARLHYAANTATGIGHNDFYEMIEIGDGLFIQRQGKIGITAGQHAPKKVGSPLPMSEWDNVLNMKLKRGWILYSDRRIEDKVVTKQQGSFQGHRFRPEDDRSADEIIHRLWGYADLEAEETYTYKVQDIPQPMVDLGTKILAELRAEYKTMSDAAFNAKLCRYFACIPRRMHRLITTRNAEGRTTQEKMENILASEEDKLAFLIDQIRSASALVSADSSKVQTISEIYGLEWRAATPDELNYVKALMDPQNRNHVIGCWRITNKRTEERFNKYCEDHGFSEKDNTIHHFWHGSPAQNWWSITTNGLWLKPGLNGGMFGPGLYFANESDKSVGYTGFGCWRGVGSDNGFLALNKVATGKPFWFYREGGTHADMSLNAMKTHGTHCLWAEKRAKNSNSTLYRDEIIIYDDAQCTIEYLVEVERH